jgi:hypothetical protein
MICQNETDSRMCQMIKSKTGVSQLCEVMIKALLAAIP